MEGEVSEPAIRYYYFRDANKRPIVTLCKYIDCGAVGYGWAVCSVLDSPCKRIGRTIALQRARAAIEGHGMPCNDTQHIFRWERNVTGWKAVNALAQCPFGSLNGFFTLVASNLALDLPESMKS